MSATHFSFTVAAAFAAVSVGSCGGAGSDETNSVWAAAMGALGFESLFALVAIAGASLAPAGVATRLGLRPGRLGAGPLTLLVFGTLGASLALDGVLDLTELKRDSALADFDLLLMDAQGASLLLAVLAFAVAPGIGEELLCRGLIQRGLVQRLGAVPGILLASVAFGALHIDPIHAAFAAVLGLYLGMVCHLADGVRASILCHTVNNLVAVLSGALLPDFEPNGALAVVCGAAVAMGAVWVVWRHAGWPEPAHAPPGGGPPAAPGPT